MAHRKSNTEKIDRRTSAQVEITRQDALALFKAINQKGVSNEAAVDILGFTDEVMENAPSQRDPAYDQQLFVRLLVEGWPQSDAHTRRNVGEIIQRIRAGQSAEEIHQRFEQRRERRHAEQEAEILNAPEPLDQTSHEWRIWKLRNLEKAMSGTDGAAAKRQAWREVRQLVTQGIRSINGNDARALQILPTLIVFIQEDRKAEQKGDAR
jgi:hypothetical protein